MIDRLRKKSILPGFFPNIVFSLAYLSFIVLIPLSLLVFLSLQLPANIFIATLTSPRTLKAFQISISTSLLAAVLSVVLGIVIAWVLVRYEFPGRRFFDAIIDIPFAMPTAVSGITLATLYSEYGWMGRILKQGGIEVAFTPIGITLALIFIGLPFIVRAVQPALEEMEIDMEEAAACLGATRWQTFRKVIFPQILPSLLTGFSMAFARGIGEYGSVIFIAGNIPLYSEIVPLLIVIELEQFNYSQAVVLAVSMLGVSFLLILSIQLIQRALLKRVLGQYA